MFSYIGERTQRHDHRHIAGLYFNIGLFDAGTAQLAIGTYQPCAEYCATGSRHGLFLAI